MKILSLRFKNLTSLKGEWPTIDFTGKPFSESGIFAIVGPNGSGKSTVLDAIPLALYGKTPRLKGHASPAEAVMTLGTDDCYAEVTFSVNGSVYRSRWEARRNGNGVRHDMRVVETGETDAVLEDRTSQVPAKVADITGLDFNRFSRSMMLAQGDFAAFMGALETERAEILEKIMGESVYDEYVEEITEKSRAAEEAVLTIEEAVAEQTGGDNGEADTLREQIDELKAALSEVTDEISALENRKTRAERMLNLKRRADEEQIAMAKARERQAALQSELQRLKKARQAHAMADDLNALDEKTTAAADAKATLTSAEAVMSESETRLETLTSQRENVEASLATVRESLETRRSELSGALDIQTELTAATENFRQKVDRYEALEKEQNTNLQDQDRIKDEQAEAEKSLEKEDAWLKSHEADRELLGVIDALRQDMASLQEQTVTLNRVLTREDEARTKTDKLAKRLAKAEGRLDKLRQKESKLMARKADRQQAISLLLEGEDPEAAREAFEKKTAAVRDMKAMIRVGKEVNKRKEKNGAKLAYALDRAEQDHEKVSKRLEEEAAALGELQEATKFSSRRREMLPGEPCPLCGSTEHPYVSEGLPLEGDLKGQAKTVRSLRKQEKSLRNLVAKIQGRKDSLEALVTAWEETCGRLGREYPLGDIQAVRADIKADTKAFKKQRKAMKLVGRHRKRLMRIEKTLNKMLEKVTARQLIVDEWAQKLKVEADQLAEIAGQSAERRNAVREIRDRMEKLLAPYGESLPEPTAAEPLYGRLAARSTAYESRREARETLIDELKKIKTRAKELPEALARMKAEAETLEPEIGAIQEKMTTLKASLEEAGAGENPQGEIDEMSGRVSALETEAGDLSDQIDATRKERDAAEAAKTRAAAERKTLAAEVDALTHSLSSRALGAGFRNLDEVRENLIPEADMTAIEGEHAAVREEIAAAERQMADIRAKLNGFEAAEDIDELTEKRRLAEKRRESIDVELSAALTRASEIEARQRDFEALKDSLDEKIAARDALREELAFIKTATRAEIRKKVRRRMMERLVSSANDQLELLSDHYQMCPSDGEQGLGLAIEDRRAGKGVRPVATLSGGESFQISLALALGLADLATPDRKIESLFLDEGFGNLDQENLARVIQSLNTLKANGKTVGVISHVQRMAEAIPTGIRLTTSADGSSSLSIFPQPPDTPGAETAAEQITEPIE